MKPGEYLLADKPIAANEGRRVAVILVRHTGDRPIQVGSHFHFFEVNRALEFDRAASYGMRLNLPAGTSARFEPGEEKEASLVEFAGDRLMFGHNGLVMGRLDDPAVRASAMERLETHGFSGKQPKAGDQ